MANNPRNRENLKPFKPGKDERRNLKGRPVLPDLKEVMAKVLGEEKNKTTAAEKIVEKMKKLAEAGNIKAAEFLFDRGYGKSIQFVEQKNQHEFTGDPFAKIRENAGIVPKEKPKEKK